MSESNKSPENKRISAGAETLSGLSSRKDGSLTKLRHKMGQTSRICDVEFKRNTQSPGIDAIMKRAHLMGAMRNETT